MGTYRPPTYSPRLQRHLERLRSEYAGLERPTASEFYERTLTGAPEEEEEEPGRVEKILAGLGAIQESLNQNIVDLPLNLKAPGPLATEAARWMQQSPDSWYRDESIPPDPTIPPPVPAGELAKDAFVARPEAGDPAAVQHSKAAVRGVVGRGIEISTDPVNVGLMAGTAGVSRVFPLVGKVASLGFGAMIAKSAWDTGNEAYELYREEGWTPAVSEKAAESAFDVGLLALPLAERGLAMRSRGRVARELLDLGVPEEQLRGLTTPELRTMRDQVKGIEPRSDLPEEPPPGPPPEPGEPPPTGPPPTPIVPRGGRRARLAELEREVKAIDDRVAEGEPPETHATRRQQLVDEYNDLAQMVEAGFVEKPIGEPGRFGRPPAPPPREAYAPPRVERMGRWGIQARMQQLSDQIDALTSHIPDPQRSAARQRLVDEFNDLNQMLSVGDAQGTWPDPFAEVRNASIPPELAPEIHAAGDVLRRAAAGDTTGLEIGEVARAEATVLRAAERYGRPQAPKQGAVGELGQDAVGEVLRRLDADIAEAVRRGDAETAASLQKMRGALAESQREVNKEVAEPPGIDDPAGQGMSDGELINFKGRLAEELATTTEPAQRARLELLIESINAQLQQPGRAYGGPAVREEVLPPAEEGPPPARPVARPPAGEPPPPTRGATALRPAPAEPPVERPPSPEAPPKPPAAPAAAPPVPPGAPTPTGPRVPPAVPVAPEEEEAAPGPPIRSDIGRTPGGKEWLIRRYDRAGAVVDERGPFATKKEAQEARKPLAKEEQAHRRAERKVTLSPEERRIATAEPSTLRADDSFDMALEVYVQGKPQNSKILKALRAARQLGQEVHPGWYDIFPALGDVTETGERTPIRKGDFDPQMSPEQQREFLAEYGIEPAPPPTRPAAALPASLERMDALQRREYVALVEGGIREGNDTPEKLQAWAAEQLIMEMPRDEAEWHLARAAPPPTPPAPAPPPAPVPAPVPPPVEAGRAPVVEGEPAPGRTRWVGRGAYGRAKVIFPDSWHADLYALGGRGALTKMATRAVDLMEHFGVVKPRGEGGIGQVAVRYRDEITELVRGLPKEEEEAELTAPPARLVGPPAPTVPRETPKKKPALKPAPAHPIGRMLGKLPGEKRPQATEFAAEAVRREKAALSLKASARGKGHPAKKARKELEDHRLQLEGIYGGLEKLLGEPAFKKLKRVIRKEARDAVAPREPPRPTRFVPIVEQTIKTASDHLDVDPQELAQAVERTVKEITVPDDVVLADIERDAEVFLAMEEAGQLEDVKAYNVVTENWDRPKKVKIRWKFHFADVPGIGAKTIMEALRKGPEHPAHKRIVAYRRRKAIEGRALEEALADQKPDFFSDPEAQAALQPVALALQEDLEDATEPETRPALMGEQEGQHPDGTESHLLKTFVWGLKKPGTQESFTTQEVIAAIQRASGQDYVRIVHAFRDAVSAEGGVVDEVPFGVPEGAPEPGEMPMEAVRRGYTTAKGYFDQAYAWSVPVKVVWSNGLVHYDAVKGLNPGHALYLARENWPDAAHIEVDEHEFAVESPRQLGGRYGPRPVRPTKKQMELFQRPAKPVDRPVTPRYSPRRGPAATGGPGRARTEPQRAPGVGSQPDRPGEAPGRGEVEPDRGGGPGGLGSPREVPRAEGAGPRAGIFEILTIRPEATLAEAPDYNLIPADLKPHLNSEQQLGVAKAVAAMSKGEGFLMADGTGVGKTRQILAIAARFARQGDPVLILAPAEVLKAKKRKGQYAISGSYVEDGATMGVNVKFLPAQARGPGTLTPGVIHISSYHDLAKHAIDDKTILIADEAHKFKRSDESQVGRAGLAHAANAKAVVFATATPGDKPNHVLYLDRIGIREGKPVDVFMRDLGMVATRQTFRIKDKKTGKWRDVEKTVWVYGASKKRTYKLMEQLFERVTRKGNVVRREIDMRGMDIQFRDITLGEETRQKMERLEAARFVNRAVMLQHQRRQQEPDKLPYAQNLITQELEAGRSVVLFASRVNFSEAAIKRKIYDYSGELIDIEKTVIAESEGTLKTLRAWLKDQGIPYAEVHGGAEAGAEAEMARFQRGDARVMIATPEAGGTGINLDDRTGARGRTMIVLTAPFDSISNVQMVGRIHRITTRSQGRVIYLFSEQDVDDWNKSIIATKMKMLGAQVSGNVGLLDPDEMSEFGDPDQPDMGADAKKQGPSSSTLWSALRELIRRGDQRIVSLKQFRFVRRRLQSFGAIFEERHERLGKYGNYKIHTSDGKVVTGRLVPPEGDVGPAGQATYDMEAKRLRYGTDAAIGIDELLDSIGEFADWRDFHTRHTKTLSGLFGADAPLFQTLLGITSQAADVRANVALAIKAYRQMRLGEPFTGYLDGVRRNLERLQRGEEIRGQKIRPYTRAGLGFDEIAVDRHIARFVLGRENLAKGAVPNAAQVKAVTDLLRQAADELGWSGDQVAAVVWAAQQIKGDAIPEDEVVTYDEVLRQHATAIRRFRSYFGDVAGPGGRIAPALSTLAAGRTDSIQAVLDFALGHEDREGISEIALDHVERVLGPPGQFKPYRVGTGVLLDELEDAATGVRWAGGAVREAFFEEGEFNLDGMEVRHIEDLGLLGQLLRNPAFETSYVFPVKNGRIMATWAETARLPASAPGAPKVAEWTTWRARILEKLDAIDADGFYFMHNHPAGTPEASWNDLTSTGVLMHLFEDRFYGHVIIDHGAFSVIDPADPKTVEALEPAKEFAQIKHAVQEGRIGEMGGEARVRELDHPSMVQLRLGERVRRAVPAIQQLHDPFLSDEIDSAAYYKPGGAHKELILTPRRLEAHAASIARQALKLQAGQLPVVVFLAEGRVRQTAVVPIELYTHPAIMLAWVMDWARATGSDDVAAIIPNEIENVRGFEGRTVLNATQKLIDLGFLVDAVVQGRAVQGATLAGFEGLPFKAFIDMPESGFAQPRRPYGGGPVQFGRPAAGGAGGGDGEEPPEGPFNWPDSRGPGTTWWSRRVAYAQARMRARLTEAAMGVDPRWFWDAVILGADRFARGLRGFSRWMFAMGGDVKDRGLLQRVWDYLQGITKPRYKESRGRVGPITPAGPIRPGGPPPTVRPIPAPTKKDVGRMLQWLQSMVTPEPGTGKPPEFNAKGERIGLSTNITRIANENGIREFITSAAYALEARFGKARSYRSWAEAKEIALELGWTERDFARALKQKGALTDYEIIAGRLLRQESGLDFLNKHQAYRDAVRAAEEATTDPERAARRQTALESEREMHAALQKAIGIQYATVAAGSEAGRALSAHRMWIESLTPEERFLQRMMRGRKPGDRLIEELAGAVMTRDQAAIDRIVRRIQKPNALSMFLEYWINSILSGPATPAANVTGNWVHEAVLRTPERGIASQLEARGVRPLIERLLTGKATPQDRVPGEMMESARALVKYKFGLISGLKLAVKATVAENVGFGVKGEYRAPAIPGLMGKIVRTPGRWMEALDIGAKYAAAASERSALTLRRAVLEGQKYGWNQEQIRARMQEISRDLSKYMELEARRQLDPRELSKADYSFLLRNKELGRMKAAMEKAADVSTFRDETTQFSKYLQLLRAKYPWLTFVIPFIRTPERILIQAVRRTPVGLAKTISNIKTGKLKGGEASDRLAQGILGSVVSAGVYMLAKDGAITGGGPVDWDERRSWLATGKRPYAVKVGDTWISMARIEPIATTLGFAADLAEATEEKVAGDIWDKLHFSIMNNITGKTYLEGMVSAAEAVGDPDRYGARFFKRMVGAMIPNMLASAARAIDPTIRDTDTIESTLMARVPWFSQQLPAKLTGLGEPIDRGEDPFSRFASPFRYAEEAGPERNLERLFLETGYSPQAPPRYMSLPGTMGRRVALTQEERAMYAAYAARATAFARTLTANDDWSELDVYAKTEFLKRIYRFAHDAGRRAMYRSVLARIAAGDFELKVR
jgi:hypothetical protein